MACAGVRTIGSFSLSEVFSTIGTPVFWKYRAIRARESGVVRLDTVCMRHGRNQRSLLEQKGTVSSL
jgi:hypothetical protein